MKCGVCNGSGEIDCQKCIYCGDKGIYGESPDDTEDMDIIDLGEF